MKLKTYLVILKNGSFAKIKSSQRPKFEPHYDELLDAPEELEHADDAEIIEETDTFGEVRKRVVVSESRKQARLTEEATRKASQEEAETQERDLRKLIKKRMKDHVSAIKAASSAAETKQALIAFVEDMEKVVLRVLK